MTTHRERTLDVLIRLNEARRIGQHEAALDLAMQLEALDNAVGYMRPIRVERPLQHGEKARGRQRNPNWRAALDKLNAMRGRSR